MKISSETQSLLGHFASINPGINIEPGNMLYTRSTVGTMIGYAVVDETFEENFVTGYLQNFLAVASLYDQAEFVFNKDHVSIESSDNSGQKSKFYYGDLRLVDQKNKLPKPQPEIAMTFTLTKDNLTKIFKAGAVLGVDDICFKAEGGKITVIALDKKVTTSSSHELEIGSCDPSISFSFYFKRKYMNIMSYSYDVEISTSCLGKFTAIDSPYKELVFFVVAEAV